MFFAVNVCFRPFINFQNMINKQRSKDKWPHELLPRQGGDAIRVWMKRHTSPPWSRFPSFPIRITRFKTTKHDTPLLLIGWGSVLNFLSRVSFFFLLFAATRLTEPTWGGGGGGRRNGRKEQQKVEQTILYLHLHGDWYPSWAPRNSLSIAAKSRVTHGTDID